MDALGDASHLPPLGTTPRVCPFAAQLNVVLAPLARCSTQLAATPALPADPTEYFERFPQADILASSDDLDPQNDKGDDGLEKTEAIHSAMNIGEGGSRTKGGAGSQRRAASDVTGLHQHTQPWLPHSTWCRPCCPAARQAYCSSGMARTPHTSLTPGRSGWTRMKRWVGSRRRSQGCSPSPLGPLPESASACACIPPSAHEMAGLHSWQ